MTVGYAADLNEWQIRPLCCRYPLVLFDAWSAEVAENGVVRGKTIHLAVGVHSGIYEVLGLWTKEGAAARFWPAVFKQLKNRGVERLGVVIAEHSAGLPRAIEAAFPATAVHVSIGHLIRHSLKDVPARHRAPVAAALRPIQAARRAAAARAAIERFSASPWGVKYPAVVKRLRTVKTPLAAFFALPSALRQSACVAAGAIERIQGEFNRMVAAHGAFPSDEAAIALAWLTQRNVMRGLRPVRPGDA